MKTSKGDRFFIHIDPWGCSKGHEKIACYDCLRAIVASCVEEALEGVK